MFSKQFFFLNSLPLPCLKWKLATCGLSSSFCLEWHLWKPSWHPSRPHLLQEAFPRSPVRDNVASSATLHTPVLPESHISQHQHRKITGGPSPNHLFSLSFPPPPCGPGIGFSQNRLKMGSFLLSPTWGLCHASAKKKGNSYGFSYQLESTAPHHPDRDLPEKASARAFQHLQEKGQCRNLGWL